MATRRRETRAPYRPYTKGRDIYDLFWYLSDPTWPPPNLALLANALARTGWAGPAMTPETWRSVLRDRLRVLDWAGVVDDVAPFLERPIEARLLTRENVLGLLGG